jgi:hypothetical protein
MNTLFNSNITVVPFLVSWGIDIRQVVLKSFKYNTSKRLISLPESNVRVTDPLWVTTTWDSSPIVILI